MVFVINRHEWECNGFEVEIIREGIHCRAKLIRRSEREKKRKANVLEDGRILCAHVRRLTKLQFVLSKVALPARGGKTLGERKDLACEIRREVGSARKEMLTLARSPN